MTRLSLAEAEEKVAALFVAAGASAANAASVAQALVAAEADGLKGHGLSRVPTYLAMLKSGKIDGIIASHQNRIGSVIGNLTNKHRHQTSDQNRGIQRENRRDRFRVCRLRFADFFKFFFVLQRHISILDFRFWIDWISSLILYIASPPSG